MVSMNSSELQACTVVVWYMSVVLQLQPDVRHMGMDLELCSGTVEGRA